MHKFVHRHRFRECATFIIVLGPTIIKICVPPSNTNSAQILALLDYPLEWSHIVTNWRWNNFKHITAIFDALLIRLMSRFESWFGVVTCHFLNSHFRDRFLINCSDKLADVNNRFRVILAIWLGKRQFRKWRGTVYSTYLHLGSPGSPSRRLG